MRIYLKLFFIIKKDSHGYRLRVTDSVKNFLKQGSKISLLIYSERIISKRENFILIVSFISSCHSERAVSERKNLAINIYPINRIKIAPLC